MSEINCQNYTHIEDTGRMVVYHRCLEPWMVCVNGKWLCEKCAKELDN